MEGSVMDFYLAPLEGINGQIYRNAFNKYFKGPDKYFMPFLHPKSYGHLSLREKEELACENNQGMKVVPQILTNDVEDFLKVAQKLQEYDYQEVNFNLGCPSASVVNKGRGSGFLAAPKQLEIFLTKVFDKCKMDISIKTRLGKDSATEFFELLEIFNKYPLKELIVHPRTRQDFYGNQPDWTMFGEAMKSSKASVCYNGDIRTKADYERLMATFKGLGKVMIGRGLIANPALLEELTGSEVKDKSRFWQFHDDILLNYQRVIPMDMEMTILFKMKELWNYMMVNFPSDMDYAKRIRAAMSLADYVVVIKDMKEE